MKILHFEDNAIKQFEVAKQFPANSVVDHVYNLSDGLVRLPGDYDLIVTDMWYPEYPGGKDNESGKVLINYIKEHNIAIPVIVVSSVDYKYDVFGNVHYDKNEDWEEELRNLLRKFTNSARH